MIDQSKHFKRVTKERGVVLDAIAKEKGNQFSTDTIAINTGNTISIATVYNCIKSLYEIGYLEKSSIRNNWGYRVNRKFKT